MDTIIPRFRQVVRLWGDRVAIRDDEVTLTYRELDERSDRFACALAAVGPGPLPVIGISLARGQDVVSATLGVLKTGRAYMFIDPATPLARKLAITRDMALEIVIGESESGPWPGFQGTWIDRAKLPETTAAVDIPLVVSRESPYCIIQTSGTTGQSLGVEISHGALLHTIRNYTEWAEITPGDRLTMLSSPAYLAASTALFGGLLNGAAVHPFDVKRRGFQAMGAWLREQKLTLYQSTPSLFRAFSRQLTKADFFPDLRLVRLGGEPVLVSDYALFRRHFSSGASFITALGMSEAGGNVAYLRVTENLRFDSPLIPVGHASPGQEIRLTDETGQVVPPGEIGEIIVRGPFLATGYYRNPELTAKRFSEVDGKRELRTGDLGRITPEGWLMHGGRKDDQVKIRGHRVDLAGLESILRSLDGVHEAALLVRKKGEGADELAAFVVPDAAEINVESLRQALGKIVPAHMVPQTIVTLSQLPLTPGGKTDRQELLRRMESRPDGSPRSPPRTDLERNLAQLWASILEEPSFGIYDDFFSAGGDSLKALSLTAAMSDQFATTFSSTLLIDRPTIAEMAEYIEGRRSRRLSWLGRDLRREQTGGVVALRPVTGGSSAPLFVCPGGWGHEHELLVFAAMLPHFPPALPVYGLKQKFLSRFGRVPGSVEAMARNFLAEIRQVQPKGPYRLLGECVSSVTILEIARQLEDEGHGPGATLILLDPRLPGPPRAAPESPADPPKVRAYYDLLSKGPLRPSTRTVHVIAPEDEECVVRRLENLKFAERGQIEFVQAPGDHMSYIRRHGPEVARVITRLLNSA